MRTALLAILSLFFVSLKAQRLYPIGVASQDFTQPQLLHDSAALAKKWSVTSYTGFSTSFLSFNGGHASMVSMPIGLQLNRRLSNNVFAFAQVAASPAYINFNPSFGGSSYNKQFGAAPTFNANAFGMSTRVAAGLMYVNDDRTFSISGSIGVEHNSYPFSPFNRTSSAQKTVVNRLRQ